MTKRLLALLALLLLALPAYAALQGSDTKPGDACSAGEAGHTRRNASATQDPTEITLICNGSQWVSANGGGTLKGTNVTGACTPALDGTIKYNAAATPAWQYCDGGTTSWLPFKLPQCADDDTGECTLAVLRSGSDPQFTAANIRCGSKLLGVTGTYGSGSSSAFTFTDVTNAAISTLTTATAVTISGIPAGCPGDVVVSGDGTPQISISGGAWGTTGSIANGQTLAVRLTSSASLGTTSTANVAIGSTTDSWTVTTIPPDTTPAAFDFTPNVTNAALSTLTTASAVTITGINTATPVSVTGSGAQISINGGAWGTNGTITNGQTLALRLTSSASFSTSITATVDVGGVTDTWSVTTLAADATPDAFTFTDVTGANLSTLTTSNAVTITGINTAATVTASGGAEFSINGGAFGTSGSITNGQTLAVRLTSSASYSTAISSTVTVGTGSDSWSVTTVPACGGVIVAGYCWYMGPSNNEDCNTVCLSHGGCDLTGIQDYAGSNDVSQTTHCESLLDTFSVGSGAVGSFGNASGCYYNAGASSPKRRAGSQTTTCESKNSAYRRVCACNG